METGHRKILTNRSVKQMISVVSLAEVVTVTEIENPLTDFPFNRVSVDREGNREQGIETKGEVAVAHNEFEIAALLHAQQDED